MVKERKYIDINVPNQLAPYLNELLRNKAVIAELEMNKYSQTLSGVGNWIIQKYLRDYTSYRFNHINTKENHITIQDRKLGRIIDVHVRKKNELWCEQDNSTACEHVKYAFQIEEVREILSKKGWDLPEREVG